jgi:hypothetical protein
MSEVLMHARDLSGERTSIYVKTFAEHPTGSEASTATSSRSRVALLISSIGWVFLGILLHFWLFAMSAEGLSPTGTLVCAFISGGVAVLVSSLSLRRLAGYKLFLAAILAAYFLRVFTGVVIYQASYDSNYFDGQGKYINNGLKGNEFVWTYENTIRAADSLLNKGEWRPKEIFDAKGIDDKNAHIHTYMGLFMAGGKSKHALDLAPFNAFHHVIAGIFVVGLALSCGYQLRIAFLSGALIAWIPWIFPASTMLRDSVGLAAVVLAMVFLYIGKEFGFIGSLLSAVPAAFLAWADRSVYFAAIVLITVLSIMFDQQSKTLSNPIKVLRLILVLLVLAICLYTLSHDIGSMAVDKRHEGLVRSDNISFRLLTLPLLILRALAGPFPWFLGVGKYFTYYNLFDYLYHVVQFAMFLIFIANYRYILARANTLIFAAAIFWVLGFIAGGVHTSYLAVASPFAVSPILNTGANVWKYVLISAICFILANVVYVSMGLAGSGLVLGTTGY